jgi:hypothetical protein
MNRSWGFPVAVCGAAGALFAGGCAVFWGSAFDELSQAPDSEGDGSADARPEASVAPSCYSPDGLYCGGNGVDGEPNILYSCYGGRLSVYEACVFGCRVGLGADGNDQCCERGSPCNSMGYSNGVKCAPGPCAVGQVCCMEDGSSECVEPYACDGLGLGCRYRYNCSYFGTDVYCCVEVDDAGAPRGSRCGISASCVSPGAISCFDDTDCPAGLHCTPWFTLDGFMYGRCQ